MGKVTEIGWTDHTFNPWWGCARVSPGCANCYAEAFAKRTGSVEWGKATERRFFADHHWREPERWNARAALAGRPALVFCASMADVFEDRPDLLEHRARLFELIEATPWLRWQLLTKRPENVLELVPGSWLDRVAIPVGPATEQLVPTWPSNVWIGTTVEDQQRADERIPLLLRVPAPVLFLSCEPLLGRVSLYRGPAFELNAPKQIGWIIVGGESGARHRPLDLDHARNLRDEALQARIPFFYKQTGGRTPKAGGDVLDGVRWKEFPGDVADRSIVRYEIRQTGDL